ncbi:efflux RND transporter permease subunit [Ruminococcus flavefaciens]|uniref:efflux RND transporter permease subunit n=1 Tax=Ruminococcus flavefaciens TaxID=1265 RepID=UPI0026EC9C4F|nr:MMPL family transporter [Ruminococcus flavefaciens]MDD7515193.1 MMPL family transporter [Ruminococcus flavefaciens]MDY5691618.1 MMPL family transporter [Ruminococcus flavefaciens]
MLKLGEWIAKNRAFILITAVILLIPSAIGYVNTRVNYDILSYLPKNINTMVGQDILKEDFGQGGFSLVMVEGMSDKDVAATADKISAVDHVSDVICYQSLTDCKIPKEILPDNIRDFFNKGDTTMMAVFFDDTTSADGTLKAVETMRNITSKQCFISGMSAITLDMKNLTQSETLIYAVIAVILTSIVLMITMDSFLIPVFFMLSIGFAVVWNLGSNIFLGEISFITQALAMVLQLGVTMDYSIFLWHSYKEQQNYFPDSRQEAMAHAIAATITSVVGSSFTTVAGFLAMCFMTFTLGLDLGIVMAKGVVCGVIACVTVLPALILIFDKAIEKTSHRDFLPSFSRTSSFIVKHSWLFLTGAIVLLIPAVFGNNNYGVYYKLDSTLPKHLDSVIANTKLAEDYNMNSTHILMVSSDMSAKDANRMLGEIKNVDGVQFAAGFNSLVGSAIPDEAIPDELKSVLKSDEWQVMLVGSEYEVASDAVNKQITSINKIVSRYDPEGMLIGEAPATKDLITITDKDFKVVNFLSIAAIFLIIAFTFRSVSLPVILVAVIELAIMINLGLAYYTGSKLSFIAPIVIGTIQLGATVDYAILMTTRYRIERSSGKDKHESISIALSTSIKSVITSALGFFAATVGVALYSDIGLISELCMLLARGALISMVIVVTVLPSMFMLFDKVICRTSAGFLPKGERNKSSRRKFRTA